MMLSFWKWILLTLVLTLNLVSFYANAEDASDSSVCPAPWHCEFIDYSPTVLRQTMVTLFPPSSLASPSLIEITIHVKIRAGYLPEEAPFVGNIIYFEGLGDSMLNHLSLFQKLTKKGFRVLAFDYMGQGGSTGSMNDTRIEAIPEIGNLVWQRFAKNPETQPYNEKYVIGWSTGGLAAYYSASHEGAEKVVLIAPGIAPNIFVGEWRPLNIITLRSLTTGYKNPEILARHIDPIKPSSPLKVLSFVANLLGAAKRSKGWNIPDGVDGLVLLSGEKDTYVDAQKTTKILEAKYQNGLSPNFKIKQYPDALHEIDNEIASISDEAHEDIVDFLLGDF